MWLFKCRAHLAAVHPLALDEHVRVLHHSASWVVRMYVEVDVDCVCLSNSLHCRCERTVRLHSQLALAYFEAHSTGSCVAVSSC